MFCGLNLTYTGRNSGKRFCNESFYGWSTECPSERTSLSHVLITECPCSSLHLGLIHCSKSVGAVQNVHSQTNPKEVVMVSLLKFEGLYLLSSAEGIWFSVFPFRRNHLGLMTRPWPRPSCSSWRRQPAFGIQVHLKTNVFSGRVTCSVCWFSELLHDRGSYHNGTQFGYLMVHCVCLRQWACAGAWVKKHPGDPYKTHVPWPQPFLGGLQMCGDLCRA